MNIALVAVASMVIWVSLKRSGVISSPTLRICTVGLMPMLPGLSAIYLINRYDSFGVVGLSLALLSLTLKSRNQRCAMLVLAGFLVGAGGGFHTIIASAIYASLALLVFGRQYLREAFVSGVGVTVGTMIAGLLIVLSSGIEPIVRLAQMDAVFEAHPWYWHLASPFRGGVQTGYLDADLLLLAAGALGLVAVFRIRPAGDSCKGVIIFGVAASFALPLALSFAGRYSLNYTWLVQMPLVLSAGIAIDQALKHRLLLAFGVTALLLVSSTAFGFPQRAFFTLVEWQARNLRSVELLIGPDIRPLDVVYSTSSGYYPVKRAGVNAYFISAFHSMTEAQRGSVTLAIIDSKENGPFKYQPTVDEALKSFGGTWEEVRQVKVRRGQYIIISHITLYIRNSNRLRTKRGLSLSP